MFLSSLLLFTMYSAFLTSLLSVFKLQMPFEDINELYLASDYKVATVDDSAFSTALESGNEIAQKIYRERFQPIKGIDEGVHYVLNGSYALIYGTQK